MARKLKPATPFGERLIQARGERSRQEVADALGCPVDTLGNYERGRTFPDQAMLAKMRETLGVSLDWLLTGEGEAHLDNVAIQPPTPPAGSFDEDLLDRIASDIAEVYREENARIYPLQLVQMAGRWYADLVAACPDPGERAGGLKAMLQQLRRELRSPQAPGSASSKRLA